MLVIKEYTNDNDPSGRCLVFMCPGCKYPHPFRTGGDAKLMPQWDFNGDFDKPTFSPSLLVYGPMEGVVMTPYGGYGRCHTFVRDGKVEFQMDCWHDLKGKVVDLVDVRLWEEYRTG